MSTTNFEQNGLITCDLCKRRYNINVYKRHIDNGQCIKRNQHRLPFESIKQRSVRIGDKIFSVEKQRQTQQNNNDLQISSISERRKQTPVLNNKHNRNKEHDDKIQRFLPSNRHRQTLERAKQLLERRTKYRPPCIQTRLNAALVYPENNSNTLPIRHRSTAKPLQPLDFRIQPTTKFKNDDLPIKISDRFTNTNKINQSSARTVSPKIRISHTLPKFKCQQDQTNQIEESFPLEQIHSDRRSTRNAYTWTRSPKQSTSRGVISPIQIPTFRESLSSLGPVASQNYNVDDEFERYSPTLSSTPKSQQGKSRSTKVVLPVLEQSQMRHPRERLTRPMAYERQTTTRFHQHSSVRSQSQNPRNDCNKLFHLPPITSTTQYQKPKSVTTRNLRPWR